MTIERKLLGTNPVASGGPEAVSFDGTNDYLLRTSDLTNNADGKTFTFSCWIYWTTESSSTVFTTTNAFHVLMDTGGNNELHVTANNSSGTKIFDVKLAYYGGVHATAKNTWLNLLISIDLSNTSNRYVYLNDTLMSSTWVTYTNDNIDFTSTKHAIGGYINTVNGSVQANFKGRLSNLFLDYTYRDLSVTSNRRLFITADGKPADYDTIPANPILYLPMKNEATAGSNSGTGGDFTAVGILATAERGPNQDNCSAGYFGGSTWCGTANINHLPDTRAVTMAVNLKSDHPDIKYIFTARTYGGNPINFYIRTTASGNLNIKGYTSAGSLILDVSSPNGAIAVGSQHQVTCSFDLTNTSNRWMKIDGVEVTPSWDTYTNGLINFTNTSSRTDIGVSNTTGKYIGNMGEFYLDANYMTLTDSENFWNEDTNEPVPVKAAIQILGTPDIAMPMDASNFSLNLGTSADIPVNSSVKPVGARGGSEFWARSADFSGGSTSYLRGNSGVSSDPSDITIVLFFNTDTNTNTRMLFEIANSHSGAGDIGVDIRLETGGQGISIAIEESDNTTLYETGYYSLNSTLGFQHYLLLSLSSTQQKASFYVDGVLADNATSLQGSGNVNVGGYMTTTIGHSIGAGGVNSHDGDIGFLYFDSSYIDFSQEANRNKFIDQLGYPVDLGADGSKPTGSSPNIYMKFDPTVSLGTNSGSGSNFSVSGTVTAGSDVDP